MHVRLADAMSDRAFVRYASFLSRSHSRDESIG
jgi:hypothetical protein